VRRSIHQRFCSNPELYQKGFDNDFALQPRLSRTHGNAGRYHIHFEAWWEDTGGPDNGPDLVGCMAHDHYLLDGVEYAVFEDGTTAWEQASPPGLRR